jgi:hypothetical protein
VGIKKSLVENRQSSSGVPSEQLVESWALQERLEDGAVSSIGSSAETAQ